MRIAPGETRLDGLPADTLDSTSGKFTIRVCSYAAGHNARVWLESPRNKTVIVDRKTFLYSYGSQSSQIVLSDVTSKPFHITVIGEDRGDGRALLARVVWIQRASPLETQFIKESHGPKHSACSPDVRVSRPMVYTLGRNFPVCLVQAKLDTVRVKVGLAWRHVGATESLHGIVKDYGAIAGINGSFFDAYVHSSVKRPNNELICMSEPVFCSDIGTVLGFTPDGEARMARSPVADALHRIDPVYTTDWPNSDLGQTLFWQRVTEGLGAGPRLVKDGAIELNPYSEGFHSAEVLRGVSMRSAVGITSSGWLMLVTTKASMAQLAHIMRALGCSQAMNLDGGSSSGLWAHGHYLRVPGRQLSNALLILRR
jgi:exopolysaccharide biosynthesis protein